MRKATRPKRIELTNQVYATFASKIWGHLVRLRLQVAHHMKRKCAPCLALPAGPAPE